MDGRFVGTRPREPHGVKGPKLKIPYAHGLRNPCAQGRGPVERACGTGLRVGIRPDRVRGP
jgi:hypothetical protein